MKKNLITRIISGIIILLLFAGYSYMRISVSPTSSEVGKKKPAATKAPVESSEVVATPEPTPTPTPEPTLDPNSPEGRAAALGLPAPPDVDINSWELILVNKTHVLDSSYAPPTVVTVSSSQCPQDSRIADPLKQFTDACAAAGHSVYLSSGYRSYNEQHSLFQNKLNQGYSQEAAAKIVTPPGTSEHQTGMCCDITDIYRNPKDPDVLGKTETFLWLNEHCAEYGFILRYPEDKQEVTGIMYEPWHFRYVGLEAAEYIKTNNLCLEEFVALYTGEDLNAEVTENVQ